MGRPSEFSRKVAVETAMNEIWRDGYKNSSVKALSEKLGITRSSFYNAFGSRQELLKEVLDTYFTGAPDRALHQDIGDASVKELITSTFRSICRARAADPDGRGCLAVNCLCELKGGEDDGAGAMISKAVLTSAARFEELLSTAVLRGELPRQTDVRAKALSLQAMLVGINAMSKTVRDEKDLWLSAKTMLQGLELYQEETSAGHV